MQVGGAIAVAVLLAVLWWRPWHPRTKAPTAPPPVAAHPAPGEKPVETGLVSSASAAPVAPAAASSGPAPTFSPPTPSADAGVAAAAAAAQLHPNAAEAHDGQRAPLMIDAPVSGGVPGAQAGNLTFMVGHGPEGA